MPSGSRIETRSAYRSTTSAPSRTSRATSATRSPGARRSKCILFFAALGSGTRMNHMLGPPQPAASTYALAAEDSSSTSEPSAAAQNRAATSASAQSNVTVLIRLAMTRR